MEAKMTKEPNEIYDPNIKDEELDKNIRPETLN